jgi:hypothetical protein
MFHNHCTSKGKHGQIFMVYCYAMVSKKMVQFVVRINKPETITCLLRNFKHADLMAVP